MPDPPPQPLADCPVCGLGADERALVHELLAAGGDVDEVRRRTGLGPEMLRDRLRAAAARLGAADHDLLERLARGVVEADDALRQLP